MARQTEVEENTKMRKETLASQEERNAAAAAEAFAPPPALADFGGPEEMPSTVAPTQKVSGSEATAQRVASQYMAAMASVSKAHAEADRKLRALGPLGPSGNSKAGLAERRELAKAVIVPGEKYFELNLEMESYLDQALRREKLPEDFVKKFLEGFIGARNNSQAHALSMKARAANLRRCKALLNLVNLLDREFGRPPAKGAKWGMSTAAADGEYCKIIGEITRASTELDQIGRQQSALKTARR
jgi:hypothetical protein